MFDTPQDTNDLVPLRPGDDDLVAAPAEEVTADATAENAPDQEPADDSGDASEETEETDDETGEEETEAAKDEAAEKPENKAATPAPATPEKIVNPLTIDPYEFDKCTIAIQIVLLPTDGSEHGREVMVGVRNHQDAPIIRVFRMDQVALPDSINGLLDELRVQLPTRAMEKIQRETKEAKKRKAASTPARPAAKPAAAPPPASSTPAKTAVPTPAAAAGKPGKAPSAGQLDMFNSINP